MDLNSIDGRLKNEKYIICHPLSRWWRSRKSINRFNECLKSTTKIQYYPFTIGSGILDDQLDSEIKHVKLVKVNLANQDMFSKIKIKVILSY